MTKNFTSLAGMFFTDSDGDRYCTGEILAEVTDGVYLVLYDGVEVKSPQELVPLEDMLTTDEHGERSWHFFTSREDLKDWVDWLDRQVFRHEVGAG